MVFTRDLFFGFCFSDYVESNMKQNQNSLVNMAECSPPLSERLREISNSLKLLSTQQISMGPKVDVPYSKQDCVDQIEPKTPGVPFNLRLDSNSNFETGTPQDIFRTRSTGLKVIFFFFNGKLLMCIMILIMMNFFPCSWLQKSLVQDCLSFLNSANK